MDCVFCKIVAGEIPSRKVYEDDRTLAFYDLDPKAPVHVLVIPKRHLGSILDPASPEEAEALFRAVQKVAALLELEKGFRCVVNTGEDGGPTVGHLHIHLLGKRKLAWPPG